MKSQRGILFIHSTDMSKMLLMDQDPVGWGAQEL